jgi:colanic acid biosynthesis glycosyl transferase WcaI
VICEPAGPGPVSPGPVSPDPVTPGAAVAAMQAPVGAHRPVTLTRGRHANVDGAAWQASGAGSGRASGSGSAAMPAPTSRRPAEAMTVPEQLAAARSVAAPAGDLIVLPDWNSLPSMEVRVDLTGVERRRARQSTRKALSWHGRFVIVHTGNIGIRQGLEDLAGALRRLAEVQPDVTVAFIGNGNRRQTLVQATTGLANVEICDPVPPDQLFAVLLAADLLLVSERSDGGDITVPSKLTSYFAAARPVLAVVDEGSAAAGEVQRSGAGVIVDPGDPLGFTAAVALLRADPAERARLGDAGLRFVAAEAMSRLS